MHAALKNSYGKQFIADIDKESYQIIRSAELNCLAEIVSKSTKNNKDSKDRSNIDILLKQKQANPFYLAWFVEMTIRVWKKYTENYLKEKEECNRDGFFFDPDMFFDLHEADSSKESNQREYLDDSPIVDDTTSPHSRLKFPRDSNTTEFKMKVFKSQPAKLINKSPCISPRTKSRPKNTDGDVFNININPTFNESPNL